VTSHEDQAEPTGPKPADLRFFWVEGDGLREEHSYHWCRDCAWVAAATWHGGRLISSDAPPPGAADVAEVRRLIEDDVKWPAWPGAGDPATSVTGNERWLCMVCRQYYPRATAVPRSPDQEPCEQCGCSRQMHTRCRGAFDRGCGMAWVDVINDGTDFAQVELLHCPCDGYAPPAGGRPVELAEVLIFGQPPAEWASLAELASLA
jgi:hypothetical protein